MDPEAWRRRIVELYERSLRRHGPTLRATRWVSEESQIKRFEVLAEVAPLDQASVADIGCGLGDLYGFLVGRGIAADYVGYDLTPGMVEAARNKYPEGRFEVRDILTEGMGRDFDYVVASGTFNIRLEDHESFLRRILKTMYEGCRRAVAFNILTPMPPEKRLPEPFATWDEEWYYQIRPEAMTALCREFAPSVELRDGYLAGEFTVYLRR